MQKIKLTKEVEAIVDDEDYEYLNQFNWYCNGYNYTTRVITLPSKKQTLILMHRLLTNCPKTKEVDHINGNRLDNRKENLRVVNRSQNAMNRKKNDNKSSIYKGVSWHKLNNKWICRIILNYKVIHLGYFINEKDAAKAYNEATIKHFGEFAKLNKL